MSGRTLGEEIRVLRGEMSQERLAVLVAQFSGKRRNQSWVSAVERDERGVDPDDLRAFARALGVTYNRLALLAGYVEEEGQSREPSLDEQIAADLLAFGETRPELMATLRRLIAAKDRNPEMYSQSMRVIHRFLISSPETVRESFQDGETQE